MTTTDLHVLASRFCDSHGLTEDIFSDEGRLYRLFLSQFLEHVKQWERREAGTEDNVLQFDLRREGESATGNAS